MTGRLALCATVAATVFFANGVGASAQTYEITRLVPGSAFHGVHGLGIDKAGRMFAGSVAGAALYEVDRDNGTAKIAIPTPEGMADDIAFAPDGTMAWTGFLTGDLYARKGDGLIKKLASGLPGINSLAYRKDGRLYATTVFLRDARCVPGHSDLAPWAGCAALVFEGTGRVRFMAGSQRFVVCVSAWSACLIASDGTTHTPCAS